MIEAELWILGRNQATYKGFVMPRFGERIVYQSIEYKIEGIVHYIGEGQLNKPHIRLYLTRIARQ